MYEYLARVKRIVDGDTFDLDIDLGFDVHVHERVRLAAIDTPEVRGPEKEAGLKASARVAELMPVDSLVTVNTGRVEKGKFGRYIVRVELADGQGDLGKLLLAEGLAEEYGK